MENALKQAPIEDSHEAINFDLGFDGKLYIFLSNIATTLASLVLPFSIMILFDRIIPNSKIDSLVLLFAIIIGSIVLDNILKGKESEFLDGISERKANQLIAYLHNLILNCSLYEYKKEKYGVYLEDINTIEAVKNQLLTEDIKQAANIFTLVLVWIVIAIIHLQTGIILCIGGIFAFSLAHFFRPIQSALIKQKSQSEGDTNTSLVEIITNTHAIKTSNMEFRMENYLNPKLKRRELLTAEYESNSVKTNTRIALINQLLLFIVVLSCAMAVIENTINQGVMAAVILLVNRYNQQLQGIISSHQAKVLSQSAKHSLNRLLALRTQQRKKQGHQTFERIDTIAIDDISLEAGDIALVSGPGASGKSYLLEGLNLSALYHLKAISVNDVELSLLSANYWQKQTVLINQESRFVDGNIIDNITCFDKSLHGTAYYLCRLFNIKNSIDSLDKGFYTNLQKKGRLPFSKKTQYLLLIIRAIICRTQVLLLDDIDRFFTQNEVAQIIDIMQTLRRNEYSFFVTNKLIENDDCKLIKLQDKV